MPALGEIAIYPVKALPPVNPSSVNITPVGGLAGDRAFAIVDSNGEYVNGKRTAAVHRLQAEIDLAAGTITLADPAQASPQTFHLQADRAALETWLSEFFGYAVELETAAGGEQTDSSVYGDGTNTGPTLISRATIRELASWYPDIDPGEMQRRLRPNLVIEDVPAFWEDHLIADASQEFTIGDVTLAGVKPVPRCVVPTRDPATGTETPGFRETFIERRQATIPEWAPETAFDHYFKVMVLTRGLFSLG